MNKNKKKIILIDQRLKREREPEEEKGGDRPASGGGSGVWVPPEGFILKGVGKFVGGGEEVRQVEGVDDTYDAATASGRWAARRFRRGGVGRD